MEFTHLLDIVGNEPVFETGLLLAGGVDSNAMRWQLSRWTQAGHLYQLRRGLYALAPPFQKVKPHAVTYPCSFITTTGHRFWRVNCMLSCSAPISRAVELLGLDGPVIQQPVQVINVVAKRFCCFLHCQGFVHVPSNVHLPGIAPHSGLLSSPTSLHPFFAPYFGQDAPADQRSKVQSVRGQRGWGPPRREIQSTSSS
jgi:hypothetical protein